MQIVNPGQELQTALESNYKKSVDVLVANAGESQVVVHGFASVQDHDGTVTMETPALSFADAQKVLDQDRFAPLVNPDFSPEITRVTFPDGYSEEFQNQISIPAVSHTLNMGRTGSVDGGGQSRSAGKFKTKPHQNVPH